MVFMSLKPQQLTHPRNEIFLQSKIKMWISNIAHDSFCNDLLQVRSKSKCLKAKYLKCLGNSNTKGFKQNSQTRIRSPEGGEPLF
jgi:hypothetical protein